LVEARSVSVAIMANPVSIPERVLGWLKPCPLPRLDRALVLRCSKVSIPERVLGWLKRDFSDVTLKDHNVSIPERVLGWLKR